MIVKNSPPVVARNTNLLIGLMLSSTLIFTGLALAILVKFTAASGVWMIPGGLCLFVGAIAFIGTLAE